MSKPKHPAGPPITLGNMRARGVKKLTIICVAAFTGGCASGDLDAVSPYAEPGKYDFLDCTSIAQRMKEASDRERQLTDLMTRAQEGVGGGIVSAVVYQDDLNITRARLRSLRKAAESKQCPSSSN
jgi:hypothetical protein